MLVTHGVDTRQVGDRPRDPQDPFRAAAAGALHLGEVDDLAFA